jgi:anti-sigma regulatory factor (Ser/Thr protein kinase)
MSSTTLNLGFVMHADEQRRADLNLTVPAQAENVAVIRRAVTGVARAVGIDEGLVNDVRTVITEACGNAAVHAYPAVAPGNIVVTCVFDHPWLNFRVRDFGLGMQPQVDENGEPRLRIGLSLMSALADRFEVQSGAGIGTEVLVGFDIGRSREDDDRRQDWERADGGMSLVAAGPLGAEAIAPAIVMLGVRSGLTVDRLSELERMGVALASAVNDGKSGKLELRAAAIGTAGVHIELDPGAAEEAQRLVASLPEGQAAVENRDGTTVVRIELAP